ncbi:cation efflux family protein [Coniella lustricola]|uniref:Cation efflux family protein n=1 Tax=Coniella lustricola TaxID=2025994 RepID=A0A2T2ZWP7_9PEZI|nr:cation efflux family protein [Coniella lustricola]
MALILGKKTRLSLVIGISFCFFVAEITVAFKTSSLALIADAFHYLNDLVSFIVALTAQVISEKSSTRQDLSFGWQRASILGAFFNGVFLLALGISILLQSIERFYKVEAINNPELVMIIGCVGLTLNVLSATVLHDEPDDIEHNAINKEAADSKSTLANSPNASEDIGKHTAHRHTVVHLHRPSRDPGMFGVLVHVIGDAINNLGVIIAAVIIWQTSSPHRFYADPAASTLIALMIFCGAIPLTKNAGKILLQSAPPGVDMDDVKHDIEEIAGIESVHELHIWRLDQQKAIASAHIVLSDPSMDSFLDKARTVSACLHAYGIHSATLQPEVSAGGKQEQRQKKQETEQSCPPPNATSVSSDRTIASRTSSITAAPSGSACPKSNSNSNSSSTSTCQMICSSCCQHLMCCN